ncbi:helix-hairpin-helix domain-containing protein [Flectobacillus roseus]|uniref:Helix-hairpin-helix domain-containing protein n=1 Tax=Flectobacillus roseus TaxID=502259 RepID=A0ABT6Y8Y5_9BACT|nr:helix-hairpin-helix domain-containing protein [Flectobacillus roseus]MDI9860043.1 helix-hairpin-helix domain-containing protein [Flectobacillus roseus]
MKKQWMQWIQYAFGYNRTEAKGFILLLMLLFTYLSIHLYVWLSPSKVSIALTQSQLNQNTVLVSLIETAENPPNRFKSFEKKEEEAHPVVPMRLHSFDPNVASVEEFEELGMPQWLAKRIDRFKSKGGKFFKKEDLLKIYDFPEPLYQKLIPYITISAPQNDKFAKRSFILQEKTPKTPAKFDLNTVDTTRLIQLKGIGSKLAARIVKYRDILGNFVSTSQIREVYGLDSLVVEEILRYGYINNPQVRKINVNESSFEQMKHPYLKPYIAKAIVNFRNQHGKFQSIQDLKAIKLLTPDIIQKLEPYLAF